MERSWTPPVWDDDTDRQMDVSIHRVVSSSGVCLTFVLVVSAFGPGQMQSQPIEPIDRLGVREADLPHERDSATTFPMPK
mmetsp:Transcript_9246/g.26027  ORF Transcript_9246/g.26027 Transcript_9246/m.26027 type:complete len:80 (+) Transcript_9246:2381-2620(+)